MFVKSTHSTNTLLKELIANGQWPETERFIRAGYQTAGRGQTGNGWESEPDKNILCSILLPPRKELFELNVIVAVAVQRMLGESFTIKWPNDIYWKDKKVAGILIESAIIGNKILYAVAGIGINVNQTEWRSDSPNPVSLKQILESNQRPDSRKPIADFPLDELMERLLEEIDKTSNEDVWAYYKAHLYRKEGYWPFVEREVSVSPTMNADGQESVANHFMAKIKDVLPSGEIVLVDRQGKEKRYHFKQIRYVV